MVMALVLLLASSGSAFAGQAQGNRVVNGKGVAQGAGIAKRQGKSSGTGVVIIAT